MPEDVPLAEQPGRLTVTAAASSAPAADRSAGHEPAPRATVRSVLDGDAWETGMRRWDLFYAAVFVAGLVLVQASEHGTTEGTVALAAVAAMAPWYLFVGRPYMLSEHGSLTARAVVYVTGLVLLFAVATFQNPNVWLLSIGLYPQCFDVLPPRRALIPLIVMNLIAAASVAYREQSLSGALSAAAIAIVVIAFTISIGGYITRIISQSRERADLIGQLEATRSELAELSRQAGVMAERQRLAAEIHDTLTQGFSSILMLVQAAQTQLESSPPTARAQLDLAAQTARENLGEARTLVGGLASPLLQPGTLEDALRRITERAGAELGIAARFETAGTGRRLAAATEVVLLRTGQEALANVRKHASAQNVTVRLGYAEGNVRLEVTDDGVGFDPALVDGGYGLRGMRSRVDEAGGTVTVRSGPAEGTSVLAEVPA